MNALMKKKIDLVKAFLFFVIFIAGCLAFAFGDDLKELTKLVLESKWTMAVVAIYVLSCAFIFQLHAGQQQKSTSTFLASLGKYTENIFSVLAYVPASTSSIALIKGLFLQHFYAVEYYSGFDKYDLASILVVSSFLLFYCLFNSTKNLISALQHHEAVPIKPVDAAVAAK
jgi:hypothetical protein